MSKLSFLGLVAILPACVATSSELCDDGRICADGRACVVVDEHNFCVTPEQRGCTNGTPCDLPGGELGGCHGDICLPISCGNEIVDLGELCDDGNRDSNDGCSSDCRSSEVCGNGVVDPTFGEQCDDGDVGSFDGCSSHCLLESPRWEELVVGPPPDRAGIAMAYDSARERTVMFLPGEGLWEWDGTGWGTIPTMLGPQARFGSALAYDRAARRAVLFGGRIGLVSQIPSNETWLWDGTSWTLVPTAEAPSRRSDHAMAYDPIRGRTVMFGGRGVSNILGDTWEFDGTSWHQLAPTTSPPALESPAMVFDPVNGQIVLFGGNTSSGQVDGMWTFDGTTWTEVPRAASWPDARERAILGVDLANHQLVLFGGSNGTELADTWIWNGTEWDDRTTTAGTLTGRSYTGSSLDANGRLVMFGGGTGTSETWIWDGAAWQQKTVEQPPMMFHHRAVLDPDRGRIVMFGGADISGSSNKTYELVGNSWRSITTPSAPEGRGLAGLAYDRARHQTLMFGGTTNTSTAAADGTWAYDGTTWTQVASGDDSPPARLLHTMTYDAARNEVVVFGGAPHEGQPSLADTWTWNGSTWHLEQPAVSPPARVSAMLAYDEVRERTYLFGGRVGTDLVGDLWEWDGTTWREIETPIAPAPRVNAGFGWDRTRQHLILVGGASAGGPMNDVWEWDGVTWTPLPVPLPSRRDMLALVPSAAGGGVEALGGQSDEIRTQRLRLRWLSTTLVDGCRDDADLDGDGLRGCDDSDCWAVCAPECPPGMSCDPAAPHCGDGTCNAALESCALCPEDCGACPALCGDNRCSGEMTSCPSDCAP